MKPNHAKIAAAAAADVALATIAAVAMAAMADAGPSLAGNNQHSPTVLVSGMIRFIPESRAGCHFHTHVRQTRTFVPTVREDC